MHEQFCKFFLYDVCDKHKILWDDLSKIYIPQKIRKRAKVYCDVVDVQISIYIINTQIFLIVSHLRYLLVLIRISKDSFTGN